MTEFRIVLNFEEKNWYDFFSYIKLGAGVGPPWFFPLPQLKKLNTGNLQYMESLIPFVSKNISCPSGLHTTLTRFMQIFLTYLFVSLFWIQRDRM